MLYWIIKWIVISLVLIILIHYLYSFLKNMLTVPKVRDLVNKPKARYEELVSINNPPKNNVSEDKSSEKKDVVNNSTKSNENMQIELKNFLQDLKKPTNKIDIEVKKDELLYAGELNNNADIMAIDEPTVKNSMTNVFSSY